MEYAEIISPILEVNSLSILLHAVLKQFLFNSFCITIISEEPLDVRHHLHTMYITPSESLDEFANQILEVSEQGCSDYVVNMKDPKIFMNALDQSIQMGINRRGNRKVIILPDTDTDTLIETIGMRKSHLIANLLVIFNPEIEDGCEVFDLVTHEFLEVEDDLPLYLDRWISCNESFESSADLFPHNISNLHGKVIRASSFTYAPYNMYDLDTAMTPSGRDGIEMRIAEEFCKWINCSMVITREDENQWGNVYDNGTCVGVVGSLYDDRSDIGVSGAFVWYDFINRVDYSASFVRSAIYCLAPSPRIVSSWEVPLMPFTWSLWYAVVCTFIFSCGGLAIARKGFKNNILLTVFGLLITQSQNLENTWRVRSVSGWLLGGSLILVSAYGAGLASTYTVPKYEPSIDTIQDLVDRQMQWGAPETAFVFSLVPSTEPLIQKAVALFRAVPAEELRERSFKRNMAYSLERISDGLFGIPNYLSEEALLNLTVMAEEMYHGDSMTLFRKSSPYTDKMTDLVNLLQQSGILNIWETQISLKYMNFKKQEIIRLSRSSKAVDLRPLSLKDVMGSFLMYGFGLAVSVSVFMAEKIKSKTLAKFFYTI